MARRTVEVPDGFPFAQAVRDFLKDFRRRQAYWYVPKGRTVSEDDHEFWERFIELCVEHSEAGNEWDQETQHAILDQLVEEGLSDPYRETNRQVDANALVRVYLVVARTLGLVYEDAQGFPFPTAAGAAVSPDDPETTDRILSTQVAKYQYPNPLLRTGYSNEFKGLLPHLFLLQVLQRVGWHLSPDEYRLFVNLALGHDDLDRVVRYVKTWRDLSERHRETVLSLAKEANPNRERQIRQNASYQLAMLGYPPHVLTTDGVITVTDDAFVTQLIAEQEGQLKIQEFTSAAEWMAYYGDPEQKPDWFTYLKREVEAAGSGEEADEAVDEHLEKLEPDEQQEVRRAQTEKWIEDSFVENLSMIEPGLTLEPGGRQYITEIGRIDLLCRGADGAVVVVEIKAGEAEDGVFGQILRYVGWASRNYEGGSESVRGIILAGSFSEKALYSRIGLGLGFSDDAKNFLAFKRHGMMPEDV